MARIATSPVIISLRRPAPTTVHNLFAAVDEPAPHVGLEPRARSHEPSTIATAPAVLSPTCDWGLAVALSACEAASRIGDSESVLAHFLLARHGAADQEAVDSSPG
jgi:hypothetical protein